jgi:hypothetical protein
MNIHNSLMLRAIHGIATSQPNDLRRRADAVLQVDEIAILGHHHHARSGRLPIDDFIVGVSQADIPDRKRGYMKVLAKPYSGNSTTPSGEMKCNSLQSSKLGVRSSIVLGYAHPLH